MINAVKQRCHEGKKQHLAVCGSLHVSFSSVFPQEYCVFCRRVLRVPTEKCVSDVVIHTHVHTQWRYAPGCSIKKREKVYQ